jgi:hypothetical protein
MPEDEMRDAAPSGPRAFPGPLAGQNLQPSQMLPPHPFAQQQGFPPQGFPPQGHPGYPPPGFGASPAPTEDQKAILAAIAALSAQLEEQQQREQERELRFAEFTQRMNEPSEEALSGQRQRELDMKEQDIHRSNREAKLDDLIAMLHAKSQQQDALLKKIAEG